MPAPKTKPAPTVLPSEYSLADTGVTQSMLTAYLCCPQRFVYVANRFRSYAAASKTAFGSLFHDVLDYVYSNNTPAMSVIEKLITEYKFENGVSADDAELFRAKAQALFAVYVKHYARDFSEKKFTQLEHTFAVDYLHVKLRGKIDGNFKAGKAQRKWIMEHKTRSRINEDDLMLHLAIDFQNLFYVLADEIETGERAHGVLYNVVRNPQARIGAKETVATFMQRLEADVAKRPEHYFMRYEVPYSAKDLARFKSELATVLSDLQSRAHFYRNPCACEIPYRCEFLEACASGTMAGYAQSKELFTELAL